MKSEVVMKYVVILCLVVWVGFGLWRSSIHAQRIVVEWRSGEVAFFPHIDNCGAEYDRHDPQQNYLYNYRALSWNCEGK